MNIHPHPIKALRYDIEQMAVEEKAQPDPRIDSLVERYLGKMSEYVIEGNWELSDLKFIESFLQNRLVKFSGYEKLKTQCKKYQELFDRAARKAGKNPFASLSGEETRKVSEMLPLEERAHFSASSVAVKKGLDETKRTTHLWLKALDSQKYSKEFKVLEESFKHQFNSSLLSKDEKKAMIDKAIYEVFKLAWKSDPQLQNNENLALIFLTEDYTQGKYLSPQLKENPEFILKVVKQNGHALAYASDALKNNPEIVKTAVQENGMALKHASNNLKNNPQIVEAAVTQNGMALQFAFVDQKNNPEIVKAALKENGTALYFASNQQKNNQEVVIVAVTQDGWALQYASNEQKNNLEVVKAAVSQNPEVIQILPHDLKNHPEIIEIMRQKG
jgi:hypothetical protein